MAQGDAAAQRFPECIDAGIRIWEQMQDWHIMDFILSAIVLKHELPENEIGQPYDR